MNILFPILLLKQIALYFSIILIFLSASHSVHSQHCQGSFDREDIEGERLSFNDDYRCGTAIMEEQMHMERIRREKKGYFDIKGFNFFGSAGFYKKNGQLYYSHHVDTFNIVPNGDASSLKYEGNFIRDKNYVYSNGKAQTIVNTKKFHSLLDSPYAKDDKYVYFSASRYNQASEGIPIVEGADPFYFETFCSNSSNRTCYNYGRDKENVYFAGVIIPEADVNSFALEESGYAHDANFVYYNGKKIEGSSGKTYKKVDYTYSKDELQVYFYGTIIPNMNGANFKLIGESGMGSDGVRISYHASVFENGDPSTLVDLGCGYYKDVSNVYSRGQIMKEIDPASFEILAFGFTKDKNGVYCDNQIILNADPFSFEVLGRKYSRDNENIFYLTTTVQAADRASFKADSHDPNKGGDAVATYHRGSRIVK